ncbi:hypothetical protein [Laspinema palackyanum]|uniref:hypothetical protein n=1 Tax=Laspinema palackyanum TaxID=3231601 RepID=UPI00345D9BFC|nr:hypothetical protein [Laspinema sp. D2c]
MEIPIAIRGMAWQISTHLSNGTSGQGVLGYGDLGRRCRIQDLKKPDTRFEEAIASPKAPGTSPRFSQTPGDRMMAKEIAPALTGVRSLYRLIPRCC